MCIKNCFVQRLRGSFYWVPLSITLANSTFTVSLLSAHSYRKFPAE